MRHSFSWSIVAVALLLSAPGCGSGSASPDATAANTDGRADEGERPDASADSGRDKQTAVDLMHPRIEVHTSMGRFVVELDAEHAPLTVQNFLAYVESGHYEQTTFHQVLADYVILGGEFTPEGPPKPTSVAIRNEAHNGLKNVRGTIAMARRPDAIDSSTCQFFINLADNPSLDHHGSSPEEYGYCVFGKVVEGFDVVQAIGQVPVQNEGEFADRPVETVVIREVRRLR